MITDDGFEVILEEDNRSFLMDSYTLRVRKIMKYGETQLVSRDLAERPEFLQDLVNQMMQRINDRINCVK